MHLVFVVEVDTALKDALAEAQLLHNPSVCHV